MFLGVWALIAGSFTFSALAEELNKPLAAYVDPQPETPAEAAPVELEPVLGHRFYALFNYSYLDLLVPGKWGGTLGAKQNLKHSWELEYLKGSISTPWIMDDIGSVTDQRTSLIRRSQIWFDSFNVGYGISYFDFNVHLGSELLDSVSGSESSSDIVKARALGTYFSIGNRWEFGGRGIVSIDWFGWSQPWIRLEERTKFFDRAEEEDDRSTAQDALSVVYRFPRFTLLKLQLGLRF